MSEKGRLRVHQGKKGKFFATVEIGDKSMPVPAFYELQDRRLDGRECEVEREKGQIVRITVDGEELPRKAAGKQGASPERKSGPTIPEPGRSPAAVGLEVFVPCDTAQCLPQAADNFGLVLHKLSGKDHAERRFVLSNRGDTFTRVRFPGIDFAALARRRQEALRATGMLVSTVRGRLLWRMVVGLGGESVYESSLTLHHIYGFPYVPASAVKGTVRSAIIQELFNGQERDALNDAGFRLLFGSATGTGGGRQGTLCFFDAYPNRPPRVVLDIMNPHYAPYYRDARGTLPPGDYYNPIPVFFLAIEDTEFVFTLGVKRGENRMIKESVLRDKTVLDQGRYWLERTLATYGLGAKTAVGYGRLEVIQGRYS